MYTDGIGFAVFVAVLALILPALWIGWWLLADLGGGAKGTYPAIRRAGAEIPENDRERQTAKVGTPFAAG